MVKFFNEKKSSKLSQLELKMTQRNFFRHPKHEKVKIVPDSIPEMTLNFFMS